MGIPQQIQHQGPPTNSHGRETIWVRALL